MPGSNNKVQLKSLKPRSALEATHHRSCDRCGVYVPHLFSCMTFKLTGSLCSYFLADGKLSLRRLRSNVGGQHRVLQFTSDTRAVSAPTDPIFVQNLFSAHSSYTFRPRPSLDPAESLTPQIPEQSGKKTEYSCGTVCLRGQNLFAY